MKTYKVRVQRLMRVDYVYEVEVPEGAEANLVGNIVEAINRYDGAEGETYKEGELRAVDEVEGDSDTIEMDIIDYEKLAD